MFLPHLITQCKGRYPSDSVQWSSQEASPHCVRPFGMRLNGSLEGLRIQRLSDGDCGAVSELSFGRNGRTRTSRSTRYASHQPESSGGLYGLSSAYYVIQLSVDPRSIALLSRRSSAESASAKSNWLRCCLLHQLWTHMRDTCDLPDSCSKQNDLLLPGRSISVQCTETREADRHD